MKALLQKRMPWLANLQQLRTGRSYDLGKMNLPQLWFAYLTYPTILLYIAITLLCTLWVALDFTSWGAVLVPLAAVLVIYPFAWYVIHRYVLHGRFLYRNKWTAGLWKRIHFDHHQDPHLLDVLFGSPLHTLPTIGVITGAIGYSLSGRPGALAAFGTGVAMAAVYEFFHCIEHLNYKPRSHRIQLMKQRHLLHHFHNEDINHGITNFFPDRLFGTYFRSAKECPRSATVFNLGYDVKEAQRYPWVMERTGSPPRDRPEGAPVARRGA